jgi:hypothetical protein
MLKCGEHICKEIKPISYHHAISDSLDLAQLGPMLWLVDRPRISLLRHSVYYNHMTPPQEVSEHFLLYKVRFL